MLYFYNNNNNNRDNIVSKFFLYVRVTIIITHTSIVKYFYEWNITV